MLHNNQQHDDYLEETLEGTLTQDDNQIKFTHSNGYIIIEENKITQKRNNNIMEIEAGKKTTCAYETEHGTLMLNITGISVEKGENELICRANYIISAEGTKPYKIMIEIS